MAKLSFVFGERAGTVGSKKLTGPFRVGLAIYIHEDGMQLTVSHAGDSEGAPAERLNRLRSVRFSKLRYLYAAT